MNSVHLFILLSHMLKTPSILVLASTSLQASYFKDSEVGGTYFHTMLFDVICRYYTKFKTVPDQAIIEAEIYQIMQTYWTGPEVPAAKETIHLMETFFTMLPKVEPSSIPVARKTIEEITRICVHDVAVKRLIDEAAMTKGLGDLPEKMIQIRNAQNQVVGGASSNNLYTGADTDEVVRLQTGIDFIDRRFGDGAGVFAHCGAALISAQGGGKTTMLLQMCVAQVLLGRTAIFCETEQGFDMTMKYKVLAGLTGIPVKIITRHKGDVWVAAKETQGANLDLVQQKLLLFNKHFYVLDMLKNPGGVEVIKNTVDSVAMTDGRPPAIVAIDWAGPLANNVMALAPKRFERKEAALKHIGGQVCDIGSTLKTFCLVSQQMAPAQIAKGPSADSDQYVAQDCKGFTESLRYVITINKADTRTGIQKLMVPKAREDKPNQVVLVRLDPETARFVEATGWKQAGRKFIAVDFKANAMPTEDAKRNATSVE